jgi:hypothetical protein
LRLTDVRPDRERADGTVKPGYPMGSSTRILFQRLACERTAPRRASVVDVGPADAQVDLVAVTESKADL